MSFRRACLLISILAAYHACTATGVKTSASKRRWWPQKEISISIKHRHDQKVAKGSHAAAQNTALDLHAFEGIILWCWAGLYHQCKEVQRVLQTDGEYRVRLEYRGDFPQPNATDDKALHIYLPAHEVKAFPPQYILYQTEQTTHPSWNNSVPFWPPSRNGISKQTAGEAFEGAIEVWEYSKRQINIFKQSQDGQRPIQFRHVPFSWFPVIPEVGDEEKDISILHYGAVDAHNRRHSILASLKKRGLDIRVAGYNVWGADLTLLIRRSKIVLNLHYFEARTLETCRIMESLSLGALIISEPGADQELRRDWEDKLVFAEGVDAIEEALRKYSSDDEARRERQRASSKHAQQHYALQKYLGDLLPST